AGRVQDPGSGEVLMSGRLADRAALVIGAARGIGRAIVERFLEEGAKVMIADVEAEAGRRTADELGCQFVQTDISKPDQATRAVEETVARLGSVDIVVQNAGIYPWT